MNKPLYITHVFVFFVVILLITPFIVRAQEPSWLVRLRQQEWMKRVASLELLKTSRADAEKILGEPRKFDYETYHFIEDYTISDGRIIIEYTDKDCTSTDGKIAKDTIKAINFTPDLNNISFSKLSIPTNQFKKVPNGDTPGFSYQNEKFGVTLYVDKNRIEEVVFEIPERKKLNCVTNSTFLNDLEKIKKMKLLESNRDEVGKFFAEYEKSKKVINSRHTETYFTGDGWFEFSYSEGKCDFDDEDGFESAEWNVEGVKISPINSINPKDYGINLDQYKKEQVYKNVNNSFVYYDKDAGVSFWVSDGEINEINFFPAKKYNSLMCNKERAKILSTTESFFTKKLKDRIPSENTIASVEKLNISQNEIIVSCSSSDAIQNKACLDNVQTVKVLTLAQNPRGDVITYSYTVTGGIVIGQGAKVVWDLSGVKPGTYTITAAVDDGCGFCGKTMTKTVVVKECPNCKQN